MKICFVRYFFQSPDPPECGNRIVESIWGEECDCGKTYEQCDDPCCYPFMISEEVNFLGKMSGSENETFYRILFYL